MERIPLGRPTREMAEAFGRRLAALHGAGAPSYGSPPPGAPGPDGWIGDLPMPYAAREAFEEFWGLDRLAATARMARDRGGLDAAESEEVDRFVADLLAGEIDAGPSAPPARVHGDLWSGNVLWGSDEHVWLSILPRTAATPSPTWRCWRCSACRISIRSWAAMRRSTRWRPAGRRGSPFIRHGHCWSTPPLGGGYGDSAMAALRRARG